MSVVSEAIATLPSGVLIGIIGHTGSGKSKLGEAIAKHTNAEWVDEARPGDHPNFEKYYEHNNSGSKPNPYAKEIQQYFVDAAFKQATQIEELLKTKPVAWVAPPQCHLMYAYLLHQDGSLSDIDYQNYMSHFWQRMQNLILPHVLVVTMVEDMDILLARIAERARREPARRGETEVSPEYWQTQIDYWLHLLRVGQNFPPGVVPTKTQQVNSLSRPMFKLDGVELHWTTKEGARAAIKQLADLLPFKF